MCCCCFFFLSNQWLYIFWFNCRCHNNECNLMYVVFATRLTCLRDLLKTSNYHDNHKFELSSSSTIHTKMIATTTSSTRLARGWAHMHKLCIEFDELISWNELRLSSFCENINLVSKLVRDLLAISWPKITEIIPWIDLIKELTELDYSAWNRGLGT